MADVLVTTLIIDASQSTQGAQEYERATRRIEESSTRATASVDRLGQSLDRAGKAMRETMGHGTALAGAQQNLSGSATNAARGPEDYNSRVREMSRLSQSGALNEAEDQAQFAGLRHLVDMARHQAAFPQGNLGQNVAPFVAPITTAAVTPEAVLPFVNATFADLKGNPGYTQIIRQTDQIQKNDPVARQTREEITGQPSISGTATAARAAGSSSMAEDAALAPVLRQLSASIDRHAAVASRIEAGTTASASIAPTPSSLVPSVGFDAAAFLQSRQPPKPPPNAVNAEEFNKARQEAFNMDAFLNTRTNRMSALPVPSNAVDAEALNKVREGPSGVNVDEWLKARKPPNEVNVEEWNKAREGPTGFLASLKALFTGAQSGAADLHASAGAVDELSHAHGRASGTAGRLREGLVLVHEFLRGDWKRAVGSATIELQRFGALGLIFNPITAGILGTVGAMALLIRRSDEISSNIRLFDVSLRMMGTDGQATGASLQQTVESLTHIGVARADARTAVAGLAQTPGLQPRAINQISDIGARVSQYRGGDVPQRIDELSKATLGGVEGLIKYGEAYNAFSANEINALRALDRAGQTQIAITRALDEIDHKLPHTSDILSGFQLAVQRLHNEWNDLLTALSKTPAVEGTITALTAVAKAAGTPTGSGVLFGAAEGALGLAFTRGIGLNLPARILAGGAGGALVGGLAPAPLQSIASAALTGSGLGSGIGSLVGSAIPIVGTGVGAGIGAGVGAAVGTGVGIYNATPDSAKEGIADAISKANEIQSKGLDTAFPDLTAATRAQTEATRETTDAIRGLGPKLSTTGSVSEASTRSPAAQAPTGTSPALPGNAKFERLVDALIQQESSGNPLIESAKYRGQPDSPRGLGQIRPSTAREINPNVRPEELFDPTINRPLSAEYLRRQIVRFGSVERGLQAYNAGPDIANQVFSGGRSFKKETEEFAPSVLRRTGGAVTGGEKPEDLGITQGLPTIVTTPAEQDVLTEQARRNRNRLEALQATPGYQQSRELRLNEINEQGLEKFPTPDARDQFEKEQTTTHDRELVIRAQQDAAYAQRQIGYQENILNATKKSIAAGVQAAAEGHAREEQLQRGGDVGVIRQNKLTLEASQGVASGEQELKVDELRVRGQQQIAAASQFTRAEQIKSTIVAQADEYAQMRLEQARAAGVQGLYQEAAALAGTKAAHEQALESSREEIEAGNELRHNRERVAAITLERSFVGQSPIEARRAESYLRTQQEVEERFPTARPEVRNQIISSGREYADLNAQLSEAEQHQQRINELFHGIANTVDGELGNALKNALIRTPLEAGEHIKNYWRDLRSSLKSTLADIVSSIAETAFIKPITSTIASGLGLGKVAQEIGGFATGGDTVVGGSGGTDSQLVQFMATPGEKIIVLTPAQAEHADKTRMLPHFATGGELDPSTGRDAVYSPASSEAARPDDAVSNMPPSAHEVSSDAIVRNPEYFRKTPISQALVTKDSGSVNVEGGSVAAAPGNVPSILTREQLTPNVLLNHPPMFKDALSGDVKDSISVPIQPVGALPRSNASPATKDTLSRLYPPGIPQDSFAASTADQAEFHGGRAISHSTNDGQYYVGTDAHTSKLPHFAGGGELDPSTGEVTQYASDGSALPEAMRSYSAMTNEITVDPLVDEYGRPKAGISEFARFPQPGTVDQSQIGDPVIASPRMRPDLAMPSPNSSPDLRPHSTTQHPYLNISYGRRTPHFATGGEYDVGSGDVSNYSEAATGPSLYDYWQKNVGDDPAALGVLDKISKNEGTYGDASHNTLFGGQKFEGDQFPQWQGMRGPWGITHAAGAYQFQPRTYNTEQERLGLPDFSKWSQDAAAWDLALRTYNAKTGRDLRGDWQEGSVDYGALGGQWASFKSKRPHFAGGGMYDVDSGDYANFAGDPEAAGAAQASSAMQPAVGSIASVLKQEAGRFGQGAVDLSQAGLKSNAEFLSGKEAKGPLLGFRPESGEFTGRLPALAEHLTMGLTGPVALPEHLQAVHRFEGVLERTHETEKTAGTASSALRLGRDVAGVRGLDAASAGEPQPDSGEIDLLAAARRLLPHFAGGGTYDPATNRTTYFNDAGQPFTLPGDRTTPDPPIEGGLIGALPALANAGLKDYGEFVSGAKTAGQPFLGFDREKMEFTGRLPVLGDFLAANVIDANVGANVSAQTLRELHVNTDLQGKLADRMAAYSGLYETGVNAPQPENSTNGPAARAELPPLEREARAAIPPPPPPPGAMLEPAYSGLFDVIPPLAEGGSILQTGAALVHAGEIVLPTEKTDDALRSVITGLQGFSTVLGQATPGLQTLGRAASELSVLGNIAHAVGNFILPSANAAPISTALGGGGLTNSQLTFNVNGVSSGGTITGPAQGGTVNSTGNVLTTIGGAAPAVTPLAPAAVPAPSSAPGATTTTAVETARRIVENAQPAASGGGPTSIDLGPADFSSGSFATQPASSSSGGERTIIEALQGPADFSSASLAPQEPSPLSAGAATAAGITRQQEQNAAAAPATSSPFSASNLAAAASGLSLIDKLNTSLPGFLPSALQSGGALSGVGSFLSNPFGLFATQMPAGQAITQGLGPLAPNAAGNVTVPGLFGTTATFGSFLSGAGAGFGAGALLNNLLGGNAVGGTVGSAGGALAGAAAGTFLFPVPVVGTLLGGLIGGTAGGGLGGLIGGPPAGQSAGAIVGPNGQLQFQDTGGSAANIQTSSQVAEQIGSFTRALSQLTDAEGKPIGTNLTGLAVSSNNRTGITVTGSDIPGGQFGQNADNAVKQTELQIIQSLTNVSGTLGKVLKNINDPAQLQSAVQFADVYDKLNVTSAELTASLNGNTNAIGPFSQALTQVNSTFSQLTAQAKQFGVSTAPIAAGLDAVTKTLNQDFRINVAEALSTAIDGGNDFIASLIKIHQQFIQNTNDATALATGVPTGVKPGFANGTLGSSSGTPPGWILVGERGPEWMFQPGGATVLPNGQQPADVPNPEGRSFAEGTIGIGDIAGQVPGIGSAISEASGGPSLLAAAGGAVGLGADTLSTIGSVLPAVPILGGIVGLATGSNPVSSGIAITTSLAALALANPVIGVVGGLVALVSKLFGPKPSNKSSGDIVDLASGTVSGFESSGDGNADTTVQQISLGISRVASAFQAATGGTISGSVNVQDGHRDGIKTSYSGPLGHIDAKWGDVSTAIGQFGLAIAHNLQGIDPGLQAQLAGINDPNALIPAIESFSGKAIDLSSSTPVAGPSAAGTDQSQAPAAASAAAPASGGDAAAPAAPAAPAGAPAAAPAATGVVWAAPTTDPALLKIFPQLGVGPTVFSDAGAAPGFANGGTTPAGWILVGERGPEWMFQAGGATVLRNGLQPGDVPDPAGRSFADGTTDIATAINDLNNGGALSPADIMAISQYEGMTGQSLDQIQAAFDAGALGVPAGAPVPATAAPANAAAAPTNPSTSAAASSATPTIVATPVQELLTTITGTEAAQAGPVLAGLGLDQLTTVINSLKDAAPEISQMAQALVDSGNALPDIMTQGIQALTDPLDLAIEKEKAAGQERVTIAQQTGQDLVEAQQLTSANLVQAVLNNLGNQNAINAISYPGNTKALETLQAAPTLAQLSGQQLNAIVSSVWQVAPDLAALASGILQNNAALPDTITQELEGIVNPLQLALQQQAAQSAARNEVGQATGQEPNQVGALNTASVVQAVLQQISNPQALQALVYGHGNLQSLTALQGGQLLGGLGTDQLNAIISQIWQVAPQLSAMASGLLASGKALPDYLTQQIEAITESGVLGVQKAAATGYEQVITAQATGQDVGQARQLGTAEVSQAVAQATNTQIPINGLPDWLTQLEEASTAPLQLAIQKEQAAGAQRVAIAQATGDDLVRVQKVNADAIAQIWYQATQQLTSLKNDITSGSLSGLTPANQVPAAVEQFNQVLRLVQGGNTNFIGELASAGTAAVQASQQAYGNGPQTASVREQVLSAISPFLVSASGYPTSGPTSITGLTTPAPVGNTDLQSNTSALQNLTAAISGSPVLGTGQSVATTPGTAPASNALGGITTNPVTGQAFTGSGITAVTPAVPLYPSASSLSNALSAGIAGNATSQDWATINQALHSGILDPAKQPGYALVIEQAQQWAAGQAVNPSAGLQQALSDATRGTPSLQEWALINQAVNSGVISPTANPQYSAVIQQARKVANAQAESLSAIPNNQTAYFTAFNGLPAFASGTDTTPPGMILVGEKGPEAYHPANDNAPWHMVGVDGPELLNQPGGATILPFPLKPSQRFAEGTADYGAGRYAWASGDSKSSTERVAQMLEKLRGEVVAELQASRKQVQGGQMNADENAKVQHQLTRQTNQYVGPNISAPARRAVG